MPVVTIKGKSGRKRVPAADAFRAKVKEATEALLDAADRVLVVYKPTGVQIYYDAPKPVRLP